MTFTRWPLPPEDVYDRCLVISCGAAVGGWDDAAPGGDFRLFRRRQVELAGRAGESRPCGRGGAGAPYRRRGARIWGVGSAVDRPGGFRGTSDKSGHRRLGRGLARARVRVFRPWANRRGGGARTRDRRPSLHRAAGCRYFPTVFFAPPWPEIFVRDEDRRHGWDEAVEECRRLERAFVALGYTVRALPKIGVGASGPITSWRPCATARKTISDRMLRGEYSGGDAASRCSPTKSKWGRHRCRPHSHRCVATSEEANLASDVSPSFCTEAQSSGSVTGARTGIRIHPPAGSSRAIGAEAVSSLAYPTLNRRLRGRMPRTGPSSGCASSGPKTFRNAPIGRRPGGPARDEIPSHFLHRVPSVRPKPSARGHSRCARTDPATSFRFEFLPFYQAVRPSSSKEFRSVPIGLKLPPPTRFDKLARPRFSTFPRFRCGLRWISHRFVAESSCDTILRRLSRFQRSRFASRRSRRALSLMKPSASFWS